MNLNDEFADRITANGTRIVLRSLDDEWAPFTHEVASTVQNGAITKIFRFKSEADARDFMVLLEGANRTKTHMVFVWIIHSEPSMTTPGTHATST
jgi:hypothetical protein